MVRQPDRVPQTADEIRQSVSDIRAHLVRIGKLADKMDELGIRDAYIRKEPSDQVVGWLSHLERLVEDYKQAKN